MTTFFQLYYEVVWDKNQIWRTCFFYSGLAAWNTLPSDLYDITDTSTFRKRLKSVLFDCVYR